jgi:hypothetical protein
LALQIIYRGRVMNIFTKYNTKGMQDRQIDTLVGLSKGLTADGVINFAEAEFLQTWLVQNTQSKNPIILNLLSKVAEILEDGVLDQGESDELLGILHRISGDKTELGEVSKTSTLPICSPLPEIQFTNSQFLFTGTCAYGLRKDCQSAIESLGGIMPRA